MAINEQVFAHAVSIISAFIANGDIRCGDNIKIDSPGMQMAQHMIVSAYQMLAEARQELIEVAEDTAYK